MPDRRYDLRLKVSAVRDLECLDRTVARRVRRALRERLVVHPRQGKRLVGLRDKGTSRPLWSFRAGDYRVIYVFSDAEVWVLVVRVGHRRGAYRDL